jgi:glycosyltransferase involved in cell wall biosynthesis
MRIVTLSTDDVTGGAARCAYTVHRGLQLRGLESTMVVRRRRSDDPSVVAVEPASRGPLGTSLDRIRRRVGRSPRRVADWVEAFTGHRSDYRRLAGQLPPHDLVHLHWVSGLLDFPSFFENLPRDTPLVWTLHDMNLLTGGCHYDGACGRFTSACGRCPQLQSSRDDDVSRRILRGKRSILAGVAPDRLRIVCTSHWLAEEARRSAVLGGRFRIDVIPGAVDTDVFKPLDQATARRILGIPEGVDVLLFVAHDPRIRRKGLHCLQESLGQLDESRDLLLVSLGRGVPDLFPGVAHTHLGYVGQDRLLSLAYSAADLFVIPSLQDNNPTTVLEALACGTPVLGFDVGGIPDMVRPGTSGRLVPAEDANALAAAITEMLDDREELRRLGTEARALALREYTMAMQASRYEALYAELLVS